MDKLTVSAAIALSNVLEAAQAKHKIARYIGNVRAGDFRMVRGTARALVEKDSENFATPGDDIFDLRLWVTTDGGFEVFWPVTELVEAFQRGDIWED